jgi:hypothetical protein
MKYEINWKDETCAQNVMEANTSDVAVQIKKLFDVEVEISNIVFKEEFYTFDVKVKFEAENDFDASAVGAKIVEKCGRQAETIELQDDKERVILIWSTKVEEKEDDLLEEDNTLA